MSALNIKSDFSRATIVLRKFFLSFFFLLLDSLLIAQFTAGNIVVLKVGNGTSATLSSIAYNEYIVEMTPNGAIVQTIPIPSSTSGARSVESGSATSDGDLNLSGNGKLITFAGYDASLPNVTIASAANINRIIGMLDNSATVSFPASYSSTTPNGLYSGNNFRSVVTNDGSGFWSAGAGTNGGINYITSGVYAGTTLTAGVVQLNTGVSNCRTVKIFNNQLYGSANTSPYQDPFSIGAGLPTTASQTFTLLNGLPNNSSQDPYSFVLFDRNRDGTPDLLYVASNTNGLFKFYLNGGVWTAAGVLSNGITGLTGYLDCNNNPVLFASKTSSGPSNNNIFKYTDVTSNSTSLPVNSLTTLATNIATAGTGYIFRGIAMAPTLGDLTVNASTTAAGNYRRIIVNSGTLTLTANIAVSDSIYIGNGAILDCGAFRVSGRSFVLDAGATLKIGDPNGIAAYAPLGNIQTSCRNYNSLATYIYEGTAAQVTGDGLPYTILNLTIDNTSTGVTLTDSVYITNLLSLTTGVLYSTSATLLIIGPSPGNAAGGSNASYVDGPMKKIGNSAFTFRTGNNGYYAAIAMSAPALVTDNFIAQYVNTSPNPTYNIFSLAPTIDHVSNCEYWYLYNSGGVSNVSVTLTWNTPRSCGVNLLTDLIVAQWDGSMWQDFGRQATIGNTVAGAIFSSIQPTVYSDTMPFTLGSISYQNPLPIELLNFNAVADGADVDINWSTATEKNNDYFNVERSADATTFTSIAKINGAGNSVNTINYADIDHQPLAGTSYYRLKQTDFDGNTTYSEIKSVTINKPFSVNGIYPNPTEDNFNIAFNENAKQQLTLKLYNSLGEVVYNKTEYFSQQTKVDIANLPSSIYFLEINGDNYNYWNKVVKK